MYIQSNSLFINNYYVCLFRAKKKRPQETLQCQEVCRSALEKSLFGIGKQEIQMAQNFERFKTDARPSFVWYLEKID